MSADHRPVITRHLVTANLAITVITGLLLPVAFLLTHGRGADRATMIDVPLATLLLLYAIGTPVLGGVALFFRARLSSRRIQLTWAVLGLWALALIGALFIHAPGAR